MAVLEIKKFKDPILRQKCEEIKEIGEEIKKLVNNMEEAIVRNQGVGLAAPQIGIKKRIIMVRTGPQESDIFALINPKIIRKSQETEIGEEGCLSFPGVFLKIKRAKEIEIEGLDISGEKVIINPKGFIARIFQHETDHLDGILFFDRLGFIKKLKFKLKYGFN